MMFATTMALISGSYLGRDRGVAFGAWGSVNGAAAGPVTGGLLIEHFGWRWIFFVNLPVSVLAVAMTLLTVVESRDPAARRVDLPGMVSFSAAAACLTGALIRGAWACSPQCLCSASCGPGRPRRSRPRGPDRTSDQRTRKPS